MIVTDEIGFLPKAGKYAVSDKTGSYYIVNDNNRQKTDTAVRITDRGYDETAGHQVYLLDFSSLEEPGIYHIESDEGESSPSFKIEPGVYKSLKNSLLKFLYFQRCGMALEEKYTGPYSRPACHMGKVTPLDGGEKISMPGGWHDAGDYGRYVSAGALAVAHMLYAYEIFPEAFSETVNIPESGNGIPDLLNECRYELDFLCLMQDEDGGLHHKITSRTFCGFVMPDEDPEDMLLFPVTSMSTADFAAVMCIASRVYEKFDPAFARDCMHRAYLAGQWLLSHPDNTDFHNPEGCNTGEYTDPFDRDERMWAYAELMRTDRDIKNEADRSIQASAKQGKSRQDIYKEAFIKAADEYDSSHPHYDGRSVDDGFGWVDVSSMAAIALLFDPEKSADDKLISRMEALIMERADAFIDMQDKGYPVSMKSEDYIWGSNMVASNRADVLIAAALMKGEKKYEQAALNQIHYILGMNAMNTSYVTGFGDHAFKNPHNRVTVADGIDKPIPGEVSGGPCTLLADEKIQEILDKNTPPQKCYLDDYLSYSTNEITIYWNSSLLFAAAYFDR
jgi:endoglucanase